MTMTYTIRRIAAAFFIAVYPFATIMAALYLHLPN